MNWIHFAICPFLLIWFGHSCLAQNETEYVCSMDRDGYETMDAWSIKDLIYLKVMMKNLPVVIVFDVQQKRAVNIYRLPLYNSPPETNPIQGLKIFLILLILILALGRCHHQTFVSE